MLLSDLEHLEDVLDDIIFEDEPEIFTENYILDFIETAFYLMDEFIMDNPTVISEPDFNEILFDEITELFNSQFEDLINNNHFFEDDMDEILENAFHVFITSFYPERSINDMSNEYNISLEDASDNIEKNKIIEDKITNLKNIPQPVQRTNEWYKFRHNLITASNAYKAFETQSSINQLIYEKCLPVKNVENIDDGIVKSVNVNTTLHWGQKYEPLSVMIYENMYNTKVDDFGCIQHTVYKFLGASPDGINVDTMSERYGRMLEIKNIVNREINGIPKKEYWIQMQLQMEVCDLDLCDFLETKFVEYDNSIDFYQDIQDNEDLNLKNYTYTKDNKLKGMIIYFSTTEGKPFYVYKPLNIVSQKDTDVWELEMISLYQSEKYNYTFIKYIYWKLEKLSCVLVLRNKEWFKNNIKQLEKVWEIIEKERISGYEHRAPVKKQKKESSKPFINTESSGCFLKFDKIIKLDNNEQTHTQDNDNQLNN
jgi:putative phage-type endonuclease